MFLFSDSLAYGICGDVGRLTHEDEAIVGPLRHDVMQRGTLPYILKLKI